jgi:hypothetical protein
MSRQKPSPTPKPSEGMKKTSKIEKPTLKPSKGIKISRKVK